MEKRMTFKRIGVLFIAIIITLSALPFFVTPVSAAYTCVKSREELEAMFPAGKYWNHVNADGTKMQSWNIYTTTDNSCEEAHYHGHCKFNGSCGCNSFFGNCIQCQGFAHSMLYIFTGGYDGYSDTSNRIRNYNTAMAQLKAGDIIAYKIDADTWHYVFVTGVDDSDTISIMDCNSDGHCKIRHTTKSKSELKNSFQYIISAPCELTSSSAKRVQLYKNATVTAKSGLKVRECPDINSPQIGFLSSGASVRTCYYPITDSSGYTWRYILGYGGWACNDYLNIIGGNIMLEGVYKIQTASCDKYLTYVGNAQADADIVIYEDNGSINQQWYLEPLGYHPDYNGAIVYRITPATSSSVALDADPSDRKNVHLWGDTNIPDAQAWIFMMNEDGSVRILNAETSLSLDVDSALTNNNTPVLVWDSHQQSNQKWWICEAH